MKFIDIKGQLIHEGIFELSEENNVLGYLVRDENNQDKPCGAVLPNGETLGDYASINNASEALFRKSRGLSDDKKVITLRDDQINDARRLAAAILATSVILS